MPHPRTTLPAIGQSPPSFSSSTQPSHRQARKQLKLNSEPNGQTSSQTKGLTLKLQVNRHRLENDG